MYVCYIFLVCIVCHMYARLLVCLLCSQCLASSSPLLGCFGFVLRLLRPSPPPRSPKGLLFGFGVGLLGSTVGREVGRVGSRGKQVLLARPPAAAEANSFQTKKREKRKSPRPSSESRKPTLGPEQTEGDRRGTAQTSESLTRQTQHPTHIQEGNVTNTNTTT